MNGLLGKEDTLELAHFDHSNSFSRDTTNDQSRPEQYEEKTVDIPDIYSSTGFDLIKILNLVSNRKNPTVKLGAVDFSCAFLIADARKFDFPIIYASESFEKMSGYSSQEVLGRNCRFLQAPNGDPSSPAILKRAPAEAEAVLSIKLGVLNGTDAQAFLVNYKKGGAPFINLVTVIPITLEEGGDISFYVGFQVDIVDQSNNILEKIANGSYLVNYGYSKISTSIPYKPSPPPLPPPAVDLARAPYSSLPSPPPPVIDTQFMMYRFVAGLGLGGGAIKRAAEVNDWIGVLVNQQPDLVLVLSPKGIIAHVSWYGCRSLLGCEPEELIKRQFSAICFPPDYPAFMREIKEYLRRPELFNDGVLNQAYRLRRKDGVVLWLESVARLCTEQQPSRGRKLLVILAKQIKVPQPRITQVFNQSQLLARQVNIRYARNPSFFWLKLSKSGMILQATHSVVHILGYQPDQLYGVSLRMLIRPGYVNAWERALLNRVDVDAAGIAGEEGLRLRMVHLLHYDVEAELRFLSNKGDDSKSDYFLVLVWEINPSSIDHDLLKNPQPWSINEREENWWYAMLERGASWQCQMHQQRMCNKQLREEIIALEQRRAFIKMRRGGGVVVRRREEGGKESKIRKRD